MSSGKPSALVYKGPRGTLRGLFFFFLEGEKVYALFPPCPELDQM